MGRRIINDPKIRWGNVLKVHGEFYYLSHYWEWLELVVARNTAVLKRASLFNAVMASLYTYDRNSDIDRAFCEAWCPSTNTLHTSAGEMSISLWDLWILGGLPIKGRFYEESIPCHQDLIGSPDVCPRSCEHLFAAYYRIVSQRIDHSQITVSEWISFWVTRSEVKYLKPPPRKPKKTSRPRSTHNPDGIPIRRPDWSKAELKVFLDLSVTDDHRDKTYLAAFLSCWLCVFVFPDKQLSLRPEVFKVASLMAEGYTFSLAVPVLANIYSGLRQVHDSTSSLGYSNACFPLHYVHGWLALYFNTRYKAPRSLRGPRMVEFSGEGGAKYYTNLEARTHIHKGKYVSWHACLPTKNKDELLTDDGELISWNASFFISIRSCFLSSQCGSSTVIEPYSPCRFSRQFGFYQDVPYDLGEEIPKANFFNARYCWMICIRENTLSQVYLPVSAPNPDTHVTSHYKVWWLAKHGDYLQEGVQHLIDRPTPPHIKSKTTKKIEHNFGSGNQKICSDETDERLVEKIEGGTKRLVDNLSLSTRFKHLIKGGIDNMGKDNRLSIATKHPSKSIEDSQSSNDDRHWKRSKKPNKQSIDDEKSPIRVPDAAQFFDVPTPMVYFVSLFIYLFIVFSLLYSSYFLLLILFCSLL